MDRQATNRQIIVYGNTADSQSGFERPENFIEFIREGIFRDCDCRYRYSQNRDAELIVLSYGGNLFGHFEVDDRVLPTDGDHEEYPPVRSVYLIRRSFVYENPVPLSDVHLSGIQFGLAINEEQFQNIIRRAGVITTHPQ